MGIIGNHVAGTTGNKASTKATKKAVEVWDEAVELLGTVADEIGGNDAFRTLDASKQVRALALQLRNNMLTATNGHPTIEIGSNTASNAINNADHTTSQTTEPSIAEQIGQKLLDVYDGNANLASNTVDIVLEAEKTDVNILRMTGQVLDALKDEKLVWYGSRYMLESERTALMAAPAMERAFFELLAIVHNGALPNANDSTKSLIADAKREIADLRNKPTAPAEGTFLTTLSDATKVTPNTGETFNGYVTRVVKSKFAAAAPAPVKADTFYDAVAYATGVQANNGEQFADYMARIVKSLNKGAGTDAGTLLDEIGNKMELKRNGETDNVFRGRVLSNVEWFYATYQDQHRRFLSLAARNSVTIAEPNKLLPSEILTAIFKHTKVEGRIGKLGGGNLYKLSFGQPTS